MPTTQKALLLVLVLKRIGVHWHRKKIAIPERYGQISM